MKNVAELPDASLRLFRRPDVPPPEQIRDVYLIGICGTGMGSLAGLLQQAGYRVRGSDENVYPPMSTRLREMGIPIYEGFDPAHLEPAPDLVVVGNAATPQHPEAACARERGIPQINLPRAVGHFFLRDRRSLVVAGTHGKTTTTGLLVHVLRAAGLDPGFLVGGVMVNDNLNYAVGSGPHFVVEGDEYDSAYFDKRPKMWHYRPSSAIVTSMEFDHADIYSSWDDYRDAFRAFVHLVPETGVLALNGDDSEVRSLQVHTDARVDVFGHTPESNVTARDVRAVSGGQRFTLVHDGTPLGELFLPLSGRHNRSNALAVAALALNEGLSFDQLAAGFASFLGMKRRQEVRGEAAGILVVDDFAHHPTAVRETTKAVAERWPDRRVVAVFEPRSNSSRRKIFEQAYAEAFEHAHRVFLSTPPVRHNDEASNLLDADAVVRQVNGRGIPASAHAGADALLPVLLDALEAGDVALVMSNGSFGGLHERLLAALRQREAAAT